MKFLVIIFSLLVIHKAYSFDKNIANKSSLLVVEQQTGRILFEKNADQYRYPASITKMMSSYLAFQALKENRINLNQDVTVSQHASSMKPTKLGLKPGTKIKIKDALTASIVKSANDATVVLAEAIAGSEAAFVKQMNQTAKLIGMDKTVYQNASGLPNAHQLSSAYDIAKLAIAIQRDFPTLYHKFYSIKKFDFKGKTYVTHNGVHRKFNQPGKTGYTFASGFNLVTTAKQDGRKIIAVVLGEESAPKRDHKMAVLLNKFLDRPLVELASTNTKPIKGTKIIKNHKNSFNPQKKQPKTKKAAKNYI
ncbi:D-alanyl-D-alanine carboxypeptidase family protein [Rickettsiales endosymbiont of Stachyamoeba lipophora]|uniref:D-alanyl-D-alanine carboxypeptidase family protein n=1 Tax=Rickettsiales endosymbiont of Stachyamoeba lipophora TaxID=2486578 RepID=UPI000F649FA7|nr:D-alanyl-D-alanine carboxypeptidase family protein [Rickettsiales endosymbiont of Stachyamoeba lipophora]AZL15379.1 D-alanyl-D-alanine carboxypeptidase [Rickettsiales endosymbiont of Stachyamoeba lipophora]